MSTILNEAFRKLEAIDQDIFDADKEGLKKLDAFLDNDEATDVSVVIDPNAEQEDELEDSYVGKILCRCVVCQSDIMKDEADLHKDEECPDVVNCGDECPMCQSVDGYKIIGRIAPYVTETEEVEVDEARDVTKGEKSIASVLNKAENKAKMEAAGSDVESLKATVLDILEADELKDNKAVENAKRILANAKGFKFLTTLTTYMTGDKLISNKKYDKGGLEEALEERVARGKSYVALFTNAVKDAFGVTPTFKGSNNGWVKVAYGFWDFDIDSKEKKNEVIDKLLKIVDDLNAKYPPEDGKNHHFYWLGGDGRTLQFSVHSGGPEGGLEEALEDTYKITGWTMPQGSNGPFPTDVYQIIVPESELVSKLKDKVYFLDFEEILAKHNNDFTAAMKEYAESGSQGDDDGIIQVTVNGKYLLEPDTDWVTSNFNITPDMLKSDEEFYIEDAAKEEDDDMDESFTASDLAKYQEWVDFDMKKYGRISDITKGKLDKAGLEVVKDDHGDYEVIAKEDDGKVINESVDSVEVKADGQKVEVKQEDDKTTVEVSKECDACEEGETIAPIDKVEEEEIEAKLDSDDTDVEEFSEEDFDELGESYLKRVYENVEAYKTVKGAVNGNKIMLEGVITFKSGKKVKTSFLFESANKTKSGKLKFLGENKQLASNKAFTLTGRKEGKKLFIESFNYKYAVKGEDGKSKQLYGTVRK